MLRSYTSVSTIALVAAVLVAASSASAVSKDAFDSASITPGGGSNTGEYYGEGNDDGFGRYGIASFNFTPGDFGAPLASITSATYTLTFNDRNFSDGSSFELFFSADDFDGSYTGLTYDDTGANDPGGLNASQFSSLVSLGSYNLGFDPTDGSNGGLSFDYLLDLSAVEAALIGEINAGSDFQLILVAENLSDDITFSGVGSVFDPGDPSLDIAGVVPEPIAASLLGLGLLSLAAARRRA